jgi:tetrahydromethanopterin S-methyltransferase subunit B
MAQIEKLNEIAPERVQWVFEETTKEGNFRRTETVRLNTLVFFERMAGIVAGLIIGFTALYASYHLAMAGHDAVAGIIGGTTVVGLVSAFVIGVRRRVAPSK